MSSARCVHNIQFVVLTHLYITTLFLFILLIHLIL
jgi:hypothetical protein